MSPQSNQWKIFKYYSVPTKTTCKALHGRVPALLSSSISPTSYVSVHCGHTESLVSSSHDTLFCPGPWTVPSSYRDTQTPPSPPSQSTIRLLRHRVVPAERRLFLGNLLESDSRPSWYWNPPDRRLCQGSGWAIREAKTAFLTFFIIVPSPHPPGVFLHVFHLISPPSLPWNFTTADMLYVCLRIVAL